MKMADCSENRAAVQLEQQKLTHGGAGFSGIVAIVCASVMSKDQSLIVISICERPLQTLQPISMFVEVISASITIIQTFVFVLFFFSSQ